MLNNNQRDKRKNQKINSTKSIWFKSLNHFNQLQQLKNNRKSKKNKFIKNRFMRKFMLNIELIIIN